MRIIPKMSPTWFLVCMSVILLIDISPAAAQGVDWTSRDSIVRFMKPQEKAVRSAECTFEVRVSPTRPEMIPLFKEVGRERGKSPENYTITDSFAAANSYTAHWWRKGVKDRLTITLSTGTVTDIAFDGQFVRTSAKNADGEERGAIETMKSARWTTLNRMQPFALLFSCAEVPYWEILEKSKDIRLTKETRGGRELTKVVMHDSRNPQTFSIELLFAHNGQLHERRTSIQFSDDPKPRINEIHTFTDYQPVENKEGEPISYPRQAVYRSYMGVTPDGTLVEYMSETIRITEIKFNVDIPDDTFDLGAG